MADLPLLTRDLSGVGGTIKQCPADFQVDEVPSYAPCGEGAHAWFLVRKTGMTTPAAAQRLAGKLGVSPGIIGFAGMKDARAVTTQWMSVEHADQARLEGYADEQVQVLAVSRHGNKLKIGHLKGNRFRIRIRGAGDGGPGDGPGDGGRGAGDGGAVRAAQAVLEVLGRRGVPNYFGAQRFGSRGDTARLGEALARADADGFLARFLGGAGRDDPPDCRAARDAFDRGAFETALHLWPRRCRDERAALSVFLRKRNAGAAAAAVDQRMRKLYLSAFQSAIFNDVLAARIDSIDRVRAGDLAQKTDSGGVFLVEDAAVEQPRADAFEISPTGPIIGDRCRPAELEPGEIEAEVMRRWGLAGHDSFRDMEGSARLRPPESKGLAETAGATAWSPLPAVAPTRRQCMGARLHGARRALRFRIEEVAVAVGADSLGRYLEVAFFAPSGCYATVALREIMKNKGG